MSFVTSADFLPYIRDTRLTQMIDSDTAVLDTAADTAVAEIRDALVGRYDIAAIFASTGADRPKQVVRWVVCRALYYLHQRLPDRLTPERVVSDFEETNTILTEISDGKRATTLTLLPPQEGHSNTSKFRWGGNAPRGH